MTTFNFSWFPWKKFTPIFIAVILLAACAVNASPALTAIQPPLEVTAEQSKPALTSTSSRLAATNPPEKSTPSSTKDNQPEVITSTMLPSPPVGQPEVTDWREMPIFPASISPRAVEIYLNGIAAGNDPTRFSKVGDCQNITTYFLAMFDKPGQYTLGEKFAPLQETIDYYAGSWSRESKAVKGGFNAASVFNPIFSDRSVCEKSESPIACELRVYKPSIVLISMEEWWNGDVVKYETYMRKIIETVIANGSLPVLATKADNLEGDHKINQVIFNLAQEYELPLWNFWAAVQPITAKGLQKDGFHLTHGLNDFSSSIQLKRGWVQRNLTALQTLDAIRKLLPTP